MFCKEVGAFKSGVGELFDDLIVSQIQHLYYLSGLNDIGYLIIRSDPVHITENGKETTPGTTTE